MLSSGTDPESNITGYNPVYEDQSGRVSNIHTLRPQGIGERFAGFVERLHRDAHRLRLRVFID